MLAVFTLFLAVFTLFLAVFTLFLVLFHSLCDVSLTRKAI